MNIPLKEDLLNKAGDLKVLPLVAKKLIESLSDDNASIDVLSHIIDKDQTIATTVLKISNSAFYGLRQEVTSLKQAIMILGLKTIRSIALAASTKSLHRQFGMTEKMMWEHSTGSAAAAKVISANFEKEVKDIAFIGGLMHDLGKVFMNNEAPEVFPEVVKRMHDGGLDSITAELDVFGYTHAEIGSRVIAKWGLAPVLVRILEWHHLDKKSIDAIQEQAIAKGVACVNLANNICKVLGIGYSDPYEGIVLHELPSAVFLNLNKDAFDELVCEIRETYEREKAVFE